MKTEIEIQCPECGATNKIETIELLPYEIKWQRFICCGCDVGLYIELECNLKPYIRIKTDVEVVK